MGKFSSTLLGFPRDSLTLNSEVLLKNALKHTHTHTRSNLTHKSQLFPILPGNNDVTKMETTKIKISVSNIPMLGRRRFSFWLSVFSLCRSNESACACVFIFSLSSKAKLSIMRIPKLNHLRRQSSSKQWVLYAYR